jgi:hypothetical protein
VIARLWHTRWKYSFATEIPRWLAARLPRAVAYHAFVRVYDVLDEDYGVTFRRIHRLWHHGDVS